MLCFKTSRLVILPLLGFSALTLPANGLSDYADAPGVASDTHHAGDRTTRPRLDLVTNIGDTADVSDYDIDWKHMHQKRNTQ